LLLIIKFLLILYLIEDVIIGYIMSLRKKLWGFKIWIILNLIFKIFNQTIRQVLRFDVALISYIQITMRSWWFILTIIIIFLIFIVYNLNIFRIKIKGCVIIFRLLGWLLFRNFFGLLFFLIIFNRFEIIRF